MGSGVMDRRIRWGSREKNCILIKLVICMLIMILWLLFYMKGKSYDNQNITQDLVVKVLLIYKPDLLRNEPWHAISNNVAF